MSPDLEKDGENDPYAKLEIYKAWWSFLAPVLSFTTGVGILFWQTVIESADRAWLIGGALTAMGWPVAGFVADRVGGRSQ